MLKRSITYTNFNDEQVTEEHYFNVTKAELVEMEMSTKEGLQSWLNEILKSEDREKIFAEFKKIIMSAYGERSADGRSFIKTPEIQEAFSHTGAFHQLLFEIATEADKAADFILGTLPKDLAAQTKGTMGRDQDKPVGGPPRPPSIKPV